MCARIVNNLHNGICPKWINDIDYMLEMDRFKTIGIWLKWIGYDWYWVLVTIWYELDLNKVCGSAKLRHELEKVLPTSTILRSLIFDKMAIYCLNRSSFESTWYYLNLSDMQCIHQICFIRARFARSFGNVRIHVNVIY